MIRCCARLRSVEGASPAIAKSPKALIHSLRWMSYMAGCPDRRGVLGSMVLLALLRVIVGGGPAAEEARTTTGASATTVAQPIPATFTATSGDPLSGATRAAGWAQAKIVVLARINARVLGAWSSAISPARRAVGTASAQIDRELRDPVSRGVEAPNMQGLPDLPRPSRRMWLIPRSAPRGSGSNRPRSNVGTCYSGMGR